MSISFRNVTIASALLTGLWCTAALGQTREDVLRCRGIPEDAQRLACYDAIPLSHAAPRGKYEPVAFQELSDAPLSFRGRLVEVLGRVISDDGGYALAPEVESGRDVPLDIDALPRQQREILQHNCAGGCEATVQGRVAPVRFVTGIVADAVVVR